MSIINFFILWQVKEIWEFSILNEKLVSLADALNSGSLFRYFESYKFVLKEIQRIKAINY
jgi:hypothetical protein